MAKPQEKQAFVNTTSPIKEHEQEGIDDEYLETSSASGCGCFNLFCFQFGRNNGGEGRGLLQQPKETWLGNKLKQAKEVSEMVAGPKWKNFIRRISKCFNKKKRTDQFQYDPQSYALNFDNGVVDEEEESYLLGYSSRFAPPSGHEERRTGL